MRTTAAYLARLTLGVAVLAAGAAMPAMGQRTSVGGSYDWSLPMGDLKDYADNDSWLGFSLDLRSFRSDHLSVGAYFGYYEFYNNVPSGSTINLPQGAVTGQQYRHMFSIPLMLNVHWYGGSGSRYDPQPFLGLNAGVTYLDQTLDIGVFTFSSDAWVVSAVPEAGIMLGTSGHTRINLHVRYHFPFTSENLFSQGTGDASMQYLSVGLGFIGWP